jgi:hypothetical protein
MDPSLEVIDDDDDDDGRSYVLLKPNIFIDI